MSSGVVGYQGEGTMRAPSRSVDRSCPSALANNAGSGSAQRSAVAVTIIGGQMLCLLPTLLITPVAYSLLAEAEIRGVRFGPAWLGRLWETVRPAALRRQ